MRTSQELDFRLITTSKNNFSEIHISRPRPKICSLSHYGTCGYLEKIPTETECFPGNWLAQMTTTNRIISSQALIIIHLTKYINYLLIRNQNKHKSSLNLVAKFRKRQCKLTSVAARYNSRTLQVSRFFKHSSGKRIYKQTIYFFLTSITEKTGLKYNNLMLLNQYIESMSINVLKHNPFKL